MGYIFTMRNSNSGKVERYYTPVEDVEILEGSKELFEMGGYEDVKYAPAPEDRMV